MRKLGCRLKLQAKTKTWRTASILWTRQKKPKLSNSRENRPTIWCQPTVEMTPLLADATKS